MSTNQLQVGMFESPSIGSDMPVKQLFAISDSVSLCDNKAVCIHLLYLRVIVPVLVDLWHLFTC